MIVFDFVVLNNLLFLLLVMIVTTVAFSAFCVACRTMYVWLFVETKVDPTMEGIHFGLAISAFCWSLFVTVSLIRWFIRLWF